MRRFFVFLLAVTLFASSAGASSLGLDMDSVLQDFLIEHRVFVTDDADEYAEFIVIFYGHDTGKVFQINDEILFDKNAGYSVSSFDGTDTDEYYPGFSRLDFASFSVEETPKAISVLFSFTKLNNPDNFRKLVQNEILTGTFPDNSVDIDTLLTVIEGRELDIAEYAAIGLHLDVK